MVFKIPQKMLYFNICNKGIMDTDILKKISALDKRVDIFS